MQSIVWPLSSNGIFLLMREWMMSLYVLFRCFSVSSKLMLLYLEMFSMAILKA